MQWEIYYVHLQSGCMLFVDMLCRHQSVAWHFAAVKICWHQHGKCEICTV